jgi:hypothetical protein
MDTMDAMDASDALDAMETLEANGCRGFYGWMDVMNVIDAMDGMDVMNAMDAMDAMDAMNAMDVILVDAWMSRMSWMPAQRQICRLKNTIVLNKVSKNILYRCEKEKSKKYDSRVFGINQIFCCFPTKKPSCRQC